MDAPAAGLAAAQAGCISRGQALALGLTSRMIDLRLDRGRWIRRHPGVYAIAGAPPSWLQEVYAAVLAVGGEAAVTHETALLLGGALSDRRVPRHPIHLTVAHGRHPRVDGAVIHQIDDLLPSHLIGTDGLAVSSAARAIVDIAASAGERRLTRLIDDLVIGKHTTVAAIAVVLAQVSRRGKPGVTRLGRVLDEMGDSYVPPQSELERLLLRALEGGRLPPPRRQVPLPGKGPITGFADAGYDDAQILVEADGRRWHTRRRDFATDRERDAQAASAGWVTLRFAWEQIVSDPRGVAVAVAETRRVRLSQLHPDSAAA